MSSETTRTSSRAATDHRWLSGLSDEDLVFLKRLLLSSGSLKELAAGYGVSYPTVRLRLDRLIEKVKIWDSDQPTGSFERMVRGLFVDGRIDHSTMAAILEAHRREMEDEE